MQKGMSSLISNLVVLGQLSQSGYIHFQMFANRLVLNLDKRAGPSAIVIKRILSSPNLQPPVRRKVEEYVGDKIAGLYGHSEQSKRAFRNKVQAKY